MNLLNLPRGTLVLVLKTGRAGRIGMRHLDPNRKPGLGRVSYDFEPALVQKGGKLVFGVYRSEVVRAAQIAVCCESHAVMGFRGVSCSGCGSMAEGAVR